MREAISALSSWGARRSASRYAARAPWRSPARTRAAATLRQAGVGVGVLGQLRRRLPLGQRLAVLVETVQRLAKAHHRRAGDGRVVEPDDPLVEAGGVEEVRRDHEVPARGRGRPAPCRGSGARSGRAGRACRSGWFGHGRGLYRRWAGRPPRVDFGDMCGRFTQQRPTSEIAQIFEADDLAGDPGGHFNVAPTDEAAVVVQRDERRAVVRYRWGLVPSWADAGTGVEGVQRPRGDPRDERPVPRRVSPAAVPRAGGRLLRVAPRRVRGASRCASTIPTTGRWRSPDCGPGARTRRPASGSARSRSSRRAPTGSWPPSTTGCRSWSRRTSWATLAGSRRRANRASCGPSWSPATTSVSPPTRYRTLVNNVRNDGPELILPVEPDGGPPVAWPAALDRRVRRRRPEAGPTTWAQVPSVVPRIRPAGHARGGPEGGRGILAQVQRPRRRRRREPRRRRRPPRPVPRAPWPPAGARPGAAGPAGTSDHEVCPGERGAVHARGEHVRRGIVGHDQRRRTP